MYWDNIMREIRLAIVFTLYVGYGRYYRVVCRVVSCAKGRLAITLTGRAFCSVRTGVVQICVEN